MNKSSKIIIVAVLILLAIYFMVMRLKEDAWICKDGQWVKHGVPSAPMPDGGCDWRDNFNPFK